ncbi:DUF2232 domain-containing protein [Acidaminobacter sp. JC074]|uniref:DUF2232 domain-containing protein n=1 Tax=Acidaminobacter sp. JC074 TaxID=2530199 RepID=UPI001F11520A|nr:DUF2232 domain-containing protein [Acidaminobacter sp. JC074]MCH4891066.1 DUF2232 domain-containing protein [Acidaminobacter sp. JC074]
MNNTKKIVTSAVMVALAVVLSLILYFLPFFQFAIFIVGIPIVVLGKVSDIKMQLMASAVVIGILMLIDPTYAATVATLVLPLAIVQGYCFHKNQRNSQNILYSSLAMVFGFLGFLYSLKFFFGVDFIEEIIVMTDRMIADAKVVYSSLNVFSEEELIMYFSMMEESIEVMKLLFPSILITYSLVNTVVSFGVSKKIMKRMSIPFEKTYFKDFRIRENARLIIMVVLGIITLVSIFDNGSMMYYASNFMSIFYIILHINGMAFVWYLFEKQPNKTAYKVVSIVVYFISPILGPLNIIRFGLGLVGFADMYADFRKRIEDRDS